MQKENLMETVVSVVAPAPVELPSSGLAAAPDRSVIDAVIAARGKIATRLNALKERVLVRMEVKEARNAWILDDPPARLLEQAERITLGLRGIGEYTGLEEDIAEKEERAKVSAPAKSPSSGLTLLIPVKNDEQAHIDAILAALDGLAATRRDNPAVDAVVAARGKIVTRLDAIAEYVRGFMDVESRRDAWDLEISPRDMLDEAEQILSDLRKIGGYAGVEEAVAALEG
ncbi:MAG: hypothetical protein IJK52_00825 [Oscillospiraceae bacterium]|nr:hypothetical protein [Oscillospiraceae bacterium]